MDTTKISNMNKLRVKVVNSRGNRGRKTGQAPEEKDKFEDLKSEAFMGHIQMGTNGSLMQKG